jgi:hypothetical protein
VIVDDFAHVNYRPFLDLGLRSQVKLDAGIVDVAQVSDVVLAIEDDNDELGVHQLLVVGDLVMV